MLLKNTIPNVDSLIDAVIGLVLFSHGWWNNAFFNLENHRLFKIIQWILNQWEFLVSLQILKGKYCNIINKGSNLISNLDFTTNSEKGARQHPTKSHIVSFIFNHLRMWFEIPKSRSLQSKFNYKSILFLYNLYNICMTDVQITFQKQKNKNRK